MTATHPVMLAVLSERPDFIEGGVFQLVGFSVVILALGLLWGLLEISGACFRHVEAARDQEAATRRETLITLPVDSPTSGDAPALSPLTFALITATVHVASKGRMRVLSATPVEPAVIHAIIAAAVHCAFEGRVRVVSVQPSHSDPSWAREGRRDIFSSHRIR